MAVKTPARLLILLKPDDNRKLVLPNGIPETMAQLTVEVRKKCEISGGFRMQYQDRDFENKLVNLESTADLEDLATIKVILIPDDGVQTLREEADNNKECDITDSDHEVDKEEQNTTDPETSESSVKVRPSTSKTNDKGKRKLDLQGESSQRQSPARKQPREDLQDSDIRKRLRQPKLSFGKGDTGQAERKRGSDGSQRGTAEEVILSDVKHIMRRVDQKLPKQDDKLNKFLKNNIKHLETDKREVVGVFGKTGAGKSSLINAVIGEQDLLPSGDISACTSVMTKVEANKRNSKYEAEIEFITKEDWKEELWTLFNFLGDNEDQEKDEDYQDSVETLSMLYGEEWRSKSPENLLDKKFFREIPEFLSSKSKILTSDTAKELSAELVKYTRSESKEEDAKDVKSWYWPLVKCVTVRVPKNAFLQHVTLVDLPGNGDRNKSRDTMWKKVIGSCSTVWIVAEINRAASEKESWEILEESCSLMGNGGECRQIHFICTKSDYIGRSGNQSAADVRDRILKRNKQAKKQLRAEFSKLNEVKKQLSEKCFEVFTVSSDEFLEKIHLDPVDTEIPELQEILQDLNEWHSETFNYVSGARGILSLMQGASIGGETDIKTTVCKELEEKLSHELDKVKKPMKETLTAFERCLSEGVEKSKGSCEKVLKSVLYPKLSYGSLKCVVEKGGIHKPKKRKSININMKFSSCLTDSIDEEFKKTFPNERNSGPFNGVINAFSLGTEKMMNKDCETVKLQLTFLKTEEEKMKTNLNNLIRERKKTIYSSLTTTIEETMKPCYDRAKEIKGVGTLKNMRETIEKHVHDSKNVMFALAKDAMMKQMRELMSDILEKLESTMQESIELSLKTDGVSIPDVSEELKMVKKYYNELTKSPDDDAILRLEKMSDLKDEEEETSSVSSCLSDRSKDWSGDFRNEPGPSDTNDSPGQAAALRP
ncbi:nuclear GTPase SLIP-GC-like [Gymnodraco acuticeps]|uniref:Nuclear GTPase SLIP-GC-like n=1 Tax=Gymnodraco acuticeps TaxID=8218 RepID=A0A6P8UTH6_GYMAC|nr:nuclear GTPase SLIP-GC-like [Gymnodraco acuticeps]